MVTENLFNTLDDIFRPSKGKTGIISSEVNINDIVPPVKLEEREDLFIMCCDYRVGAEYYNKVNDNYSLQAFLEDEEVNLEEDIFGAYKIPDCSKEQIDIIGGMLLQDYSDYCKISEDEYNYLKSIGK